jgi:deoxyribonuclease-4
MDDRQSGLARNADAIPRAGASVGAPSWPRQPRPLVAAQRSSTWARRLPDSSLAQAHEAFAEAGVSWDVSRRFDDTLGLSRLRVMHLNDSKTSVGSRRDRHELIGEGTLGEQPFRRIMTDECLARVPKLIETPKGTDPTASDRRMLERLRGYAQSG